MNQNVRQKALEVMATAMRVSDDSDYNVHVSYEPHVGQLKVHAAHKSHPLDYSRRFNGERIEYIPLTCHAIEWMDDVAGRINAMDELIGRINALRLPALDEVA